MRIVLDTNVLVSALIVPSGASHQLWERCAAGDYELVTSLQQLEELERVLQYPKLHAICRPELPQTC
ncbi:MAG: putative toxin-antitoxin system toxin component, PIN family [Pirellulales bacterium]|nr:putative toxin-antitoxin system toxin component, PIN family [Pirellulales bacterium]